jgi:hypothetical protein
MPTFYDSRGRIRNPTTAEILRYAAIGYSITPNVGLKADGTFTKTATSDELLRLRLCSVKAYAARKASPACNALTLANPFCEIWIDC